MIENLPTHISVLFDLTTVLTLLLFYRAVKNAKTEHSKSKAGLIIIALTVWLVLQGALTLSNFYNTDTLAIPPRFVLLIFPPILTIVLLFATQKGRDFIDSLPLLHLTWLNIVRIPVELILYALFLNHAVPELMTFAGRNFDILSGITAPFIAYYGFRLQKIDLKLVLIWNVLALCLLANIVINAVLSAPFAFQQLAFDQPNIAVLYFPFSWLPAYIVPTVLFGHLVSIRQLAKNK